MNSYQRVMNRLAGKPVDRLPNMSLVMMFAAKLVGVSFGQYCTDYRYLVEGAFRCHEQFGFDMVCAISDPMREAEGFGAKVVIPDDGVPYCPVKRLQSVDDIATLKVIAPESGRRMHDRLEAIRSMKERAGHDIPVVGWVEGALAECCDLMDMQEVFANLLDEPEAMETLIDICMEQGIRFAKAQVDAGADIIGIGDAATSLIGPSLYEEFVLSYQQKMIAAIHEMGAKVKLHICGNLNPVLHLVAQTGADIVDLDYMVDMNRAADMFPETCSICGNMDPVSVIYQGTPETIKAAVRQCMAISGKNNNFIAPGCEIPKDTPVENVLALQEAIAELPC
ncbi:MAG: uroporphyrinogen decarboxylase family protein [Clostridia bacterium]|nr:uroporphyrinogen decarboxylase family protein [Clostridia bacterium]